ENGESTQVTEWFEATSIAKISELIDRQGQPKERFVKSLNRGTDGATPFDSTARYQLSRWGIAALAESEATIRGTDFALFKNDVEEKTYYDLSQHIKVPSYTVDPK